MKSKSIEKPEIEETPLFIPKIPEVSKITKARSLYGAIPILNPMRESFIIGLAANTNTEIQIPSGACLVRIVTIGSSTASVLFSFGGGINTVAAGETLQGVQVVLSGACYWCEGNYFMQLRSSIAGTFGVEFYELPENVFDKGVR